MQGSLEIGHHPRFIMARWARNKEYIVYKTRLCTSRRTILDRHRDRLLFVRTCDGPSGIVRQNGTGREFDVNNLFISLQFEYGG